MTSFQKEMLALAVVGVLLCSISIWCLHKLGNVVFGSPPCHRFITKALKEAVECQWDKDKPSQLYVLTPKE